jgi:tRNA threonylcarbamoyladenosine biosynthesis protein TsaB
MLTILAIETSGALCSVALERDGTRFELTQHVERRHNELLLVMVDDVCRQAGVSRQDITALAFGCGPGSFTGVRIAAAAVQAMSLVLDVPVLPVPSSWALAYAARRLNLCDVDDALESFRLVTSIRSRSDLYYVAVFRVESGELALEHGDVLYGSTSKTASKSINPSISSGHFAGDVRLVGARPDWWDGNDCALIESNALDVLTFAQIELALGKGVKAAHALPLYVTGDTPWRPRNSAGH